MAHSLSSFRSAQMSPCSKALSDYLPCHFLSPPLESTSPSSSSDAAQASLQVFPSFTLFHIHSSLQELLLNLNSFKVRPFHPLLKTLRGFLFIPWNQSSFVSHGLRSPLNSVTSSHIILLSPVMLRPHCSSFSLSNASSSSLPQDLCIRYSICAKKYIRNHAFLIFLILLNVDYKLIMGLNNTDKSQVFKVYHVWYRKQTIQNISYVYSSK